METLFPMKHAPRFGRAYFREDEYGLTVWWVEGREGDAWSARITFWLTIGGHWNCRVEYGRTMWLDDVGEVKDLAKLY